MKPVLTAEEYRRVDRAYIGDLIRAMDRAGHAVALAAARAGAGYGKRVAVLSGPGNNGGDGYVAARYLKERGASVTIHALAEPKTTEAKDAAAKSSSVGVPSVQLGEPVGADVVVDALFGGGSRRGLPDEILDWMGTPAPVVSIDYPTGLDPNTGKADDRGAFRAVETVTFGSLKTGHILRDGPDHCGEVTVASIGIDGGKPSMYLAEEVDAPKPSRKRTTHKWSAGAVLVLGGSPGLIGASVLAGRSALNFAAGTVYLATPSVDQVQQIAPELPVLTLEQARSQLARFDIVVAGPGLADEDAERVRPLLAEAGRVVLDAGGLTPAIFQAAKNDDADVVVTPHDGEFARIAGVDAGTYSCRSFAAREGVIVLRKGNPTMVSNGGLPVLVTTGGPELASIGTGDVLAGMVGALWARGLEPLQAAVSAAYWHGVAGRELARYQTVTADVLSDYISAFAW
jgi:ADP-dependent NAD(P)H-hydrate dehydratase / NAD(P)H-hydrate epimerase